MRIGIGAIIRDSSGDLVMVIATFNHGFSCVDLVKAEAILEGLVLYISNSSDWIVVEGVLLIIIEFIALVEMKIN